MIPVRDIMTTDVVTVDETDTLHSAASKMVEHKIGCVVVCSERKPVGILTETDLVKKIIYTKEMYVFDTQVKDAMTQPVVFVHPLTALVEVARLMNAHNIKRVPVVDPSSGELVGIVSAKDMIAAETNLIHVLRSYLKSRIQ